MKKGCRLFIGLTSLAILAFSHPVPASACKEKNNQSEAKPVLPEGMKGFSGILEGVVVSKEKLGFVLDVSKVVRVWDGNKAKNPKSAIGRKLLVNAQWEEAEDGRWRPVPNHTAFIESLSPKETIQIEVVNDELERLHILELSKEQRGRAAAKGKD